MSNTPPEELIKKYLNHTCTTQERAIMESWYNDMTSSAEPADDSIPYEQLDKEIWKELKKTSQPIKKINWPLIASAAALILICSVFYHSNSRTTVKRQPALTAAKILPGSNKAELLLDDGTIMPLKDDKAGLLTRQNGIAVIQLPGGKLSYDASGASKETEVKFNTLRTPRGGQYEVELPDGTKAWLNAASTIKFPTIFKQTERIVEISGEVYFEVIKNKNKPFKVISAGQTVEVLGTHFSVSTYPDEKITKTTLFEGSVKVSHSNNSVIIKPGEQTHFNADAQEITIINSDLEEALAWRQGYLMFHNEDVKSIMRKLSRWYDIDVAYSANFINQRFTGSVSRFEEAAKVLKMLEYTGTIHFKTEGRRVTVMP